MAQPNTSPYSRDLEDSQREFMTWCSVLEAIPPPRSYARRRRYLDRRLPQGPEGYVPPLLTRSELRLGRLSDVLAFLLDTGGSHSRVAVAITGITKDKVNMVISCDVLGNSETDDIPRLYGSPELVHPLSSLNWTMVRFSLTIIRRLRQARVEKHMNTLYRAVQALHTHTGPEGTRVTMEVKLLATQLTYALKTLTSDFQDLKEAMRPLTLIDLSRYQFEPRSMTNETGPGTRHHVPPLLPTVKRQDKLLFKNLREIYLSSAAAELYVADFLKSNPRLMIKSPDKKDFIVWHILYMAAFEFVDAALREVCDAKANDNDDVFIKAVSRLLEGMNVLHTMTSNSSLFRKWAAIVQKISFDVARENAARHIENIPPYLTAGQGPNPAPSPTQHLNASSSATTTTSRSQQSPQARSSDDPDNPNISGDNHPPRDAILPRTSSQRPPRFDNQNIPDTSTELELDGEQKTSNEIFISVYEACTHMRLLETLFQSPLIASMVPGRSLSLRMIPEDLGASLDFNFAAEDLSETLSRTLDWYSGMSPLATDRAEKFITSIPMMIKNPRLQDNLMSLDNINPVVKAVYHAETLLLGHLLGSEGPRNWTTRCMGISREPCLVCGMLLLWYSIEPYDVRSRHAQGSGRAYVVAIPQDIPDLDDSLKAIFQAIADAATAEVNKICIQLHMESPESDDSYSSNTQVI
ncbi:hypothetical protein ABW21_db0200272 [Orbilia brochopaga]|nr:hypothetical protein ABW21_db0200272 [Drechslerella brochopaga]